MSPRTSIPKTTETEVLLASKRRCCLCIGLFGSEEIRKGQTAHLNHDASNSRFDNLVFLCLEHHDEFDGRTSQSELPPI